MLLITFSSSIITYAVKLHPLTAQTRSRSQVCPSRTSGQKSETGRSFFPSALVLPSQFYSVYIMYSGHAVAQLVETLRYKPEGRGFDSRWCHWNFSLT